MKIKVECEQNGTEIIAAFVAALKEKNLDVLPDSCKILATKKDGGEVEISADKLRIIYTNG